MANPSYDKGNVAELLRIGGQMANVMFNLAQRPGDALTGAHVAAMDSLRKQWDAVARATPPSPSTAPEVDYLRAAAEAVVARWDSPKWKDEPHTAVFIDQLRAALASRPAEVDDEGLPPLPEAWHGFRFNSGWNTWEQVSHWAKGDDDVTPAYTAEQYRQGQRDAVAADRARRGSQL